MKRKDLKARLVAALALGAVLYPTLRERTIGSPSPSGEGAFARVRDAVVQVAQDALLAKIRPWQTMLQDAEPDQIVDLAVEEIGSWPEYGDFVGKVAKAVTAVAARSGLKPMQWLLRLLRPTLARLPPQAHRVALAHVLAQDILFQDGSTPDFDDTSRVASVSEFLLLAAVTEHVPWETTIALADDLRESWEQSIHASAFHRASAIAADEVLVELEIDDHRALESFLVAYRLPLWWANATGLSERLGVEVRPVLSWDPELAVWSLVLETTGDTPVEAMLAGDTMNDWIRRTSPGSARHLVSVMGFSRRPAVS